MSARFGPRWTAADLPDQTGRVIVVTGANSGIGFEVATAMASHGGTVVLACRNDERAARAAEQIASACSDADLRTVTLDLADLASVQRGAAEIRSRYHRLDLLIANAGVSMPPRQLSVDGYELQFATNHLGHFALVGRLLDRLMTTPGSRVVTVTSMMAAIGRIAFDDLDGTKRYSRPRAYAQSKLATSMFAFELQRRLDDACAPTIALVAHPGSATTNVSRHIEDVKRLLAPLAGVLQQGADLGALPILRAAVDPDARGGELYGPRGLLQWRGYPRRVRAPRRSHDVATARRLWDESERRTGVEIRLRPHSVTRAVD